MLTLPDASMIRRGLRTLSDELAFRQSELGRWAAEHGTSPAVLRTLVIAHIQDRARQAQLARTARRFGIVAACDLKGESHKRIAGDFGLSRAQFYRERRLAIDELRTVIIEAVSAKHQTGVSEPFRSIIFGTGDRERAFRELREVAVMLTGASGNGVAARLAREARAAAAIFEEHDGSIAV